MTSLSEGEGEDDIAVKLEPIDFAENAKPHSVNKRDRSFGSDAFTALEERNIRQKLDIGLSRNETMQRPGPGGCKLTYIEGWKVIHDANQIFGFNGWSSHIIALDLRFVDEFGGRFTACVSATVRITLRDGAYREDRGGGNAENMRSKGEAIMKAEKEAVTDATKRALKNFGLRLGLSLYDRQHVRDMNKPHHVSGMGPAPVGNPGGLHTPQSAAKQPACAGVHRTTPQRIEPATPTTAPSPRGGDGEGVNGGGGGGTLSKVEGNNGVQDQVAAKREQAVMRKQAFLKAKAAEDKAKMHRNNAPPSALRAQNGVSMAALPMNNVQSGGGQGNGILPQQQQRGKAYARGNPFSPVSPAQGVAGGHVHGVAGVEDKSLAQSGQNGQQVGARTGEEVARSGTFRPANGRNVIGAAARHNNQKSNYMIGHENGSKTNPRLNDGRAMRQKEIEEATRMAMAEF